jgi:exonuclease III
VVVKLVIFNINGVIQTLMQWPDKESPDIACLQADGLGRRIIKAAQVFVEGQKGR